MCFSVVAGLLVGPTLIPGQKSETANAALVALDEPAKDATHRTFRLTVNGPDGKPVSNASCEIREPVGLGREQIPGCMFEKNGSQGTFTETNEDGEILLSLPKKFRHLTIIVEKTGFGPYWAKCYGNAGSPGIPSELTIQLEDAWSVGGTVVDTAGTPIPDAKVQVSINYKMLPNDTDPVGLGAVVQTDEEGKWRYDLVPVSQDYVQVTIDHSKHQPLRMPLPRADYEVKTGESPSTEIVLPSGVTITGSVIDDHGQPIENALVRAKFFSEIREAKTDKDEKYAIIGCDQNAARVVASGRGRALELQFVRIAADMKPVDFILKPGGHVRVRIVDETGKGIPKASISFQRWRGKLDYFEFRGVDAYTDENGVWEWNEAPLDEFRADISTPGRIGLPMQSLTAREEEYVFTPP